VATIGSLMSITFFLDCLKEKIKEERYLSAKISNLKFYLDILICSRDKRLLDFLDFLIFFTEISDLRTIDLFKNLSSLP
jgi:hypothetical protein